MNAIRIAAAAVLLGTIAAPAFASDVHAQHIVIPRASTYARLIPPGCSQKTPDKCFPGGHLIVQYVPVAQVADLCNMWAPVMGYAPTHAKGTMGCTLGGLTDPNIPDVAVIVVGDDFDTEDTFFHEVAHVMGLNADHDNY